MSNDASTGTASVDGAVARSGVYALLSQALSYPTPDDVDQLVAEDLPFARACAGDLPRPVRAALAGVEVAFEGTVPASLEAAYRELFTHVHSRDCPLYETDFTAREVWRQSQELADLAGFYRAFGVEQRDERPDHAAVELEFLHVLTYKAAWADARGQAEHARICRAAHEAFLRDHVLRWIPGLARRIRARAGGSPYAAVAALAEAFLVAEASRFGVAVPAEEPEPVAATPVPEIRAMCEGER